MKRLGLFAALAVSSWASVARADDTSLETLLSEEVVTSVSNTAETSDNAPALTRSISADEIHRYGMTTVEQALDFLGVGVHSEHALARSELTVRGVAFPGDRSNHILLLVDGHIINEPLFGDAPLDNRLGIPLELIDHIELVLGPGSAVYGTNAVLAVVNVVTKSASDNKGFHVAAEAGVLGRQRTTLSTGQQFELFGKRASFTAGINIYHRNETVDVPAQTLVDPLNRKTYTWGGRVDDSNFADAGGVHLHFVRDRLDVMARATYSSAGDPTGTGDFDHPGSGNVQRRASLAISQSAPLGNYGDLRGTIYADTFAERQRLIISRPIACPFGNIADCDFDQRFGSNRLGADLRANLDWLHDGRLVTLAGTSASWDHVSGFENALDYTENKTLDRWRNTVTFDSVLNLAANLQQTWKPLSWIDFTGGARLDWRKLDDDNHDGTGQEYVFEPVVTPRLAMTARPWTGGTAKLLYAEAFRAPNPYELDGRSATLIQSVGLQPEHTTSIEAIFEQRIQQQRFMFGLFRTDYRGIINRLLLDDADTRAAIAKGLTPLLYDRNVPLYQYRIDDHDRSEGFNLGIDGAALQNKLRFAASFTGAHARADTVERMPVAPQWFGNARASYDLGAKLPTVAIATSFGGNALGDRSSEFSRPSYAPPMLEVRATLTGAVPWVPGLSYRAIFDHQTAPTTPFGIGPELRAGSPNDRAALAPAQRWNAIFGLQYDFGQ